MPISFQIQDARPEHVPGLVDVHIASWRSTYRGIVPDPILDNLHKARDRRAEYWHKQIREGVNVQLVAVDDAGKVVGFASGGPLRDDIPDYDCELYAIYLLEDVQGQGIGRALTRHIATRLHKRGFKQMLVWVLKDNPFRAFYEALGAIYVTEKTLDIGGVDIIEHAYGWRSLDALLEDQSG